MSEEAFRKAFGPTINLLTSNVDSLAKTELSDRFVAEFNELVTLETLLKESISEPYKQVALLGLLELRNALTLATLGLHKASFSASRSSLELLVAAPYFAMHPLKHLFWSNGRTDIVWAQLMDDEVGLFSGSNCDVLAPDLLEKSRQFQNLSKSAYRECSEFVHANPSACSLGTLNPSLCPDTAERLLSMFQTIRLIAAFAFLVIHRSSPTLHNDAVRDMILEFFPQSPEIRSIYE